MAFCLLINGVMWYNAGIMLDNIEKAETEKGQDELSSTGWLNLGIHTYVKVLIIGVLFYWFFSFEINQLFRRWFNDSDWSHGILIPFFSLYFVHQRRSEILKLKSEPSYLGLLFLVLGLVLYIFNIAVPGFRYGYIRSMLMIGIIGSIVLLVGGWRLVKYTWLPIFFLIFAIPLPVGIHEALTMPLRHWAAVSSSALLSLSPNIEATANGVIIDVVYNGSPLEPSLDVADACSGMRLLLTFVALGVAMAYLHYRPIWQRSVLLVSTIPIAILCNIIRVFITGYIYIYIGSEYIQGIYHDMLGISMLPLAFLLYGLIAWFMSNLFLEPAGEVEEEIVVRKAS